MDQHPAIQLNRPVRPEPKFFLKDNFDELGLEYYLSTWFAGFSPAKRTYILEKSTSYADHPPVVDRIKQFFPAPAFLMIFRHPVHRALSNYKFSVDNGLETRSPEEVFLNDAPAPPLVHKISVAPFDYLKRSDYPAYLKAFQEEGVHYVILEKLLWDAAGEWNRICEYLQLDAANFPLGKTLPKVNASKFSESIPTKVLEYLKKRLEPTIDQTERLLGEDLSIWRALM